MNSEQLLDFEMLACKGPQGPKSDAIRALVKEIRRLQKRKARQAQIQHIPTSEEVQLYAREIEMKPDAVDDFLDHYTSVGWRYGKGGGKKVVDFKSAMRRWNREEKRRDSKNGKVSHGVG